MNGGMLVFHNSGDTSYANHSRNLSSMSSATGVITLRFLGQGASATATSTDAVVLTVTGGKEEIVMEFLASVMANPQHGMQVIADDNSGYYSHANILTVSSISVDSGAGTFKNVITTTAVRVLTSAESGSTVFVNHAARLITLPPAIAGLNFKIVLGIDATSGMNIVTATAADHFFGTIPLMCSDTDDQTGQAQELTYAVAVAAPASYDAMKFIAATATIGGIAGTMVEVYCIDDVSWHVKIANHMTNANDPGQCALIVAR